VATTKNNGIIFQHAEEKTKTKTKPVNLEFYTQLNYYLRMLQAGHGGSFL
jgi:hypothetical protein